MANVCITLGALELVRIASGDAEESVANERSGAEELRHRNGRDEASEERTHLCERFCAAER